ncbi:ANTAR domain-containing response regulator [Alkalihalobacillus sp. BA299]|uniref:ANTAR domain-containing response regulator n=1 Tax=Alkalihalobacillus sp. BA299 TaxID=2815938 RepID=UPI001ADD02DA|nr:response regulator [Alkalihalobacillus sp. BA299]
MKKRILVVEDESITRLDLSMMLEENGYEVVGQAGDGEAALEKAFLLKPDLIIMDIKMPKLNGLKASEIISKKINTPILILTAYSQREYIDKAKQVNIMGYLVKPITEANLIPAVEIALKQAEHANGYRAQVETMNQKLEERKIVEKAKGIVMKKYNIDEEAAYNKIRKISMNKQVTLEKVAKQIITKFDA